MGLDCIGIGNYPFSSRPIKKRYKAGFFSLIENKIITSDKLEQPFGIGILTLNTFFKDFHNNGSILKNRNEISRAVAASEDVFTQDVFRHSLVWDTCLVAMLGVCAVVFMTSNSLFNGRAFYRRASHFECTIPVVLYLSQLIYSKV